MTDQLPIEVFATGIPKGQPRGRATGFKFTGPDGHPKFRAKIYDDGKADDWKGSVKEAFKGHHGLSIHEPVAVAIELFFPRPKGHFGKRGLLPSAPVCHTGKPDLDNAAKAILDAMTDFQFWKDDSACVSLLVTKRWTSTRPGALITVRSATPNPPSREG